MLTLITPPQPIFTVAEAKKHLNIVDYAGDDLYVDTLIEAVTDYADGPEAALNGRCLAPQVWDWTLDADLPADLHTPITSPFWVEPSRGWRTFLELPLRPVLSVDLVEYVDTDGNTQAWTDYDVLGAGQGVIGPTRIQPSYGTSWPSVRAVANAVRIRFTAGYGKGNGESPETIIEATPPKVKAALLLMLGDLYNNRETAGEPSGAVQALLAPFRIWR